MVPLILIFTLLFSGCAKVSYLMEQGVGQLSLLAGARKNKNVLKDPDVDLKVKEKIRQIEKYKKHFYSYFQMPTSDIYSKTNILDRPAVTYLVISSPYNKIKAHKECFPFYGCFPYLGFFSKKSALEYAEKRKKEGAETWVRPVYAYSTLGNFEDPILSSFFYYEEHDLAELIFHELFHTIFFVTDEVALNENLANFFGEKMAYEYFDYDEAERKKLKKENAYYDQYSVTVVGLVEQLKKIYAANENAGKDKIVALRESFMKKSFYPALKGLCKKMAWENKCKGVSVKWNNARLAAYMTYENQQRKIEKYFQNFSGLKSFYLHLKDKYKQYEKDDPEQGFAEYLLEKK